MTMKILIPYNFTANDEKAIDFVTNRYPDHKNIQLTLFHAYQPIPEIHVKDNPIMDKMNRTTAYLRQVLSDQKKELEQVKARLAASGFRSENIECMFTALRSDVATDLVRLIQSSGFDAVVFTRNPGTIMNYFSRSISKTVSRNLATGVSVHLVN